MTSQNEYAGLRTLDVIPDVPAHHGSCYTRQNKLKVTGQQWLNVKDTQLFPLKERIYEKKKIVLGDS